MICPPEPAHRPVHPASSTRTSMDESEANDAEPSARRWPVRLTQPGAQPLGVITVRFGNADQVNITCGPEHGGAVHVRAVRYSHQDALRLIIDDY
jgi:hypothetical protein